MKQNRINEIDLARACAIILMIIFHFIYDLNEFMGIEINYSDYPWVHVGKISALLFIFISGICTNFSEENIKKGFKLYLLAMGVTAITYVVFPDSYIRFGILHFLGISIMLSYFLSNIKNMMLLIISALCIIVGYKIKSVSVNTFWFIPIGVTYKNFLTIDYYPLFPYIGYFILGILFGKVFYKNRKSFISLGSCEGIIRYISKHSLLIYLIHQPIIISIMFLLRHIQKNN